jgi:hypothetical protein
MCFYLLLSFDISNIFSSNHTLACQLAALLGGCQQRAATRVHGIGVFDFETEKSVRLLARSMGVVIIASLFSRMTGEAPVGPHKSPRGPMGPRISVTTVTTPRLDQTLCHAQKSWLSNTFPARRNRRVDPRAFARRSRLIVLVKASSTELHLAF